MTTRSGAQRRHLASSPFKPRVEAPVAVYEVDDRVSHDQFGLGRVVGVEEGAVSVDFGSTRVRVVTPFSKLEKL